MTKKTKKTVDATESIEISDIDANIDIDSPDFPVEKFMKTLGAIDWKLWEILQLLQKWDEEDEDEKPPRRYTDD